MVINVIKSKQNLLFSLPYYDKQIYTFIIDKEHKEAL